MSTALAEDELLAEARLPLLSKDTKFGFNEFSRRAGDFAMAASLVTYRLQGGKIADARVGVGGAEPCPRRIPEAEAALNGKGPAMRRFAPPLKLRPRRSTRWKIIRRTPTIAATWCARLCDALWSRARHERAWHPRLRDDLGRTLHPAAGGPGTDHRSGPLHRRLCLPRIGCVSFAARLPQENWRRSPLPNGAMVITAADLKGVKKITPMLHKFSYKPVGQPVACRGRRALYRRACGRRCGCERRRGRRHCRASRHIDR